MLTHTNTPYIQLGVGREGQSQDTYQRALVRQVVMRFNPKFGGGVEKTSS